MSALTLEKKPRDDWNIVSLRDERFALRARRTRSDDGQVSWNAVDHDVQERTDDKAQKGTDHNKNCKHTRHRVRSSKIRSTRLHATAPALEIEGPSVAKPPPRQSNSSRNASASITKSSVRTAHLTADSHSGHGG